MYKYQYTLKTPELNLKNLFKQIIFFTNLNYLDLHFLLCLIAIPVPSATKAHWLNLCDLVLAHDLAFRRQL